MSRLTDSFRNIFKIHELRQRIIYSLALLIIVRIGAHITIPGVDASLLAQQMNSNQDNTLFGLYDMFVGGAFSNAAIFALGIMPYISSSIIIQLLGAFVPYFQKLSKEGEEGRKKITQLTRYFTVLIAALQSWGCDYTFVLFRCFWNAHYPRSVIFMETFSGYRTYFGNNIFDVDG